MTPSTSLPMHPSTASAARRLAAALLLASLAACGGGDDDSASTSAAASVPTCNTAAYVAGAVEAPSTAQLAAYAGRYAGQEGHYDDSFNFVASGSATLELGADAQLSYKGTRHTVSSVCIDKVAGSYGKLLYLLVGSAGHFDVSDTASDTLGQAWGVSPVDGTTVFTGGVKAP